MSYCRQEGKDQIIFLEEEDYKKPAEGPVPNEEEDEEPGLILENGDINWNCPCLGGMATGPCGYEFREAFSCFHYSTEEMKGSDCYNQFKSMQECMSKYPTLYDTDNDKDPLEDVGEAEVEEVTHMSQKDTTGALGNETAAGSTSDKTGQGS